MEHPGQARPPDLLCLPRQIEVTQGNITSEISLLSTNNIIILGLGKYLYQGNCLENLLIVLING